MMKTESKSNIYKPTNKGTQKVTGNATQKSKITVRKTGKK